jgi:uncharacterized membrane protein YqjE
VSLVLARVVLSGPAWRPQRLVRLFALVVPAMAFAGFSCMTLAMLLIGLFDMSLRVVVDIFCTSKAHPLDGALSSSRWSRCATSGFFSRSPTPC